MFPRAVFSLMITFYVKSHSYTTRWKKRRRILLKSFFAHAKRLARRSRGRKIETSFALQLFLKNEKAFYKTSHANCASSFVFKIWCLLWGATLTREILKALRMAFWKISLLELQSILINYSLTIQFWLFLVASGLCAG